MKALPPILNREFKLPGDGKVHLVPKGNYPVVHNDIAIVQVVDDSALRAMESNFLADITNPDFGGLCIDFDHARHAEHRDAPAGGWLDSDGEIENRAKGLFGSPRWSTTGKAAVEGGDYRFISPEFDPLTLEHLGGNRFRPTRLVGFGLTNNPNMRGMSPLSNRRGGASGGANDPAAEPKTTPKNMKAITSLLGLADGADETQITSAITVLSNSAKEVPVLNRRVKELEDERVLLIGESIDADLATHGITDAATIAKIKPVLLGPTLKNRADRVEFIALFPKPAAATTVKKPLTNRAAAQTPDVKIDEDPDASNADQVKRGNAITNRARELRKGDPKLSQNTAYNMARVQIDTEATAAK